MDLQGAPPVMHCQDLNPYVASALGDWAEATTGTGAAGAARCCRPCFSPRTCSGR